MSNGDELESISWFVEGMRAERDSMLTLLEEIRLKSSTDTALELIDTLTDLLNSKEW